MAEALYMVSKANADDPQQPIINGIHVALVNSDDGGTDAQIISEATAKCVSAGHPLPSGYFDTVTAIGDLTNGPLPTDEDTLIILPRTTQAVTS